MSPFLQLILDLAILVLAAKLGGWLATRLHQPAVLGELLTGLILGPSLLNELQWPIFANPENPHLLGEVIFQLAELGVLCLMFLAGLEIDFGEMLASGRVAVLAGVNGVIVPLIFGALGALAFGYSGGSAFFVGIILTATSVSISTQTLLELGKLRTREGLTLLGAAVIDDVLVILLLSVFMALAGEGGSIWVILVRMIGYFLLATLLAFLFLPRLAMWVERQPISEGLASLVFITLLLFAWFAEAAGGLAAITGAFIAGLGFGRSRLRESIGRKMHSLTYAFLVPIFFVSIGLKTDLHSLQRADFPFAIFLVGIAVAAKVVGSGLGARVGGFTPREALRVGLGMISRGEVGLIVASVGVQAELIPSRLFSVVTLIVLVTTLITPPLLRISFASRQPDSRNPKHRTPEKAAQLTVAAGGEPASELQPIPSSIENMENTEGS